MPTFDYAAYDISGKLVDGVVSADSERHARRILKEKKLLPATAKLSGPDMRNNLVSPQAKKVTVF